MRTRSNASYINHSALGIVFLTVFLDLLGFGIVLPLMPIYAQLPQFHASSTEIGWLMAVYSLMQFIFAPLWGRMSDHVGRKPILIIGLFGSAAAHLVYGLAGSLTVLFLARVVAGVSGANLATAQAVIADVTSPDKRAAGMGMIGAAFGLGFVLGPALGGLLSGPDFGNHPEYAPYAASLLCFLNGVMGIILLPETRRSDGQRKQWVSPLSVEPWKLAFGQSLVAMLLLVSMLLITGFASFEVALPLYGKLKLGWSLTSVGYFFAYVGVLITLVQGVLVRRVVPWLGEVRTAAAGFVLLILAFVMLAAAPGPGMLLVIAVPLTVGFGLLTPSLSSLLSRITSSDTQGTVMGLYQSVNSLGRVIGPALGGFFFATEAAGMHGPVAPFVAACVMLVPAMVLLSFVAARHPV
jgi:MFS transporter, DHA1 family, tetracycline resistance protein